MSFKEEAPSNLSDILTNWLKRENLRTVDPSTGLRSDEWIGYVMGRIEAAHDGEFAAFRRSEVLDAVRKAFPPMQVTREG